MKFSVPITILGIAAAAVVVCAQSSKRHVSYAREIKPLLEKNCAPCHYGSQRQGGLSLSSVAQILNGGTKSAAVIPGKASESRIILLMEHKAEPKMPPIPGAKPLDTRLLRAWIDSGAKDDSGPLSRIPTTQRHNNPRTQLSNDPRITSVAFSPNGRILAVGGHKTIALLDAITGHRVGKLDGPSGAVTSLAFTPDSGRLVASSGEPGRNGEIRMWKVTIAKIPDAWTVKRTSTLNEAHADVINSLAVSPNGKWIAAASYDQQVSLRQANVSKDSKTSAPRYLKDHTDSVYSVAFSPDSRLIASAGGDRTVKVWSVQTGKRLYTLSESTAELYSLAFSPNGKQIAAGGADRTLRTWDISAKGGKLARAALAHEGPILRVMYALNGRTILTAAQDRMVKRWDSVSLAEKLVFPKQPDWPQAIALSPNEKLLAVGRHDGSLAIYNADSGRLVREPIRAPAIVRKPPEVPSTSTIPGRRPGDNRRIPRKNGPITLTPASLSGINPTGAQRGKSVRFTLSGANIADATNVYFDDPAITGKIVTPADSNAGILRVDTTIADSARIGIHRVFVTAPRGTTGSAAFAIGGWSESAQVEPNDDYSRAQQISIPTTVLGAMDQPGDIDTYSVNATVGQEIVFEIVGAPIRSRLQPVLRILDPTGKVVTENRTAAGKTETVVGYRCVTTGPHFIQVSDFEGAAGGDVHYRLNAGEFPVVTRAFPLGIRKGATSPVQISGFNLGGKTKADITAPSTTVSGQTTRLTVDSVDLLQSVDLAVGADPEENCKGSNVSLDSAQAVPIPITINGTLSIRDGRGIETDRRLSQYFRFPAKKGEKLILETMARRLGSRLDSEIEVLDLKGNPVERAVLRAVGQTELVLVDRDSASVGLRLQAWDDFRVNDYVLAGRELIRIQRLPAGPDEDVFFRAYRGQRLAYLGTTPEYHSLGEPIYKVEVHPPGARFSPNGYPLRRLPYCNDDGGPLHGKDSYLEFTPPADGEYVVRLFDPRGHSGDEYPYRLMIHKPRPDYRLAMNPEHPNVPAGGAAVVEVTCERYDGFDGEIEVGFDSLPAGFTATRTTVEPGETSAFIHVRAEPGASHSSPSKLIGTAVIDGKQVTHSLEAGSFGRKFTVLTRPDIRMTTNVREVTIRPGEEVTMEAEVERMGEFGNRIPVIVQNLPFGVRVTDIGLNGVLITEEEKSRRFTIFAEPWVKPQTRTFYVSGNVEGGVANAAEPLIIKVLPSRSADSTRRSSR